MQEYRTIRIKKEVRERLERERMKQEQQTGKRVSLSTFLENLLKEKE